MEWAVWRILAVVCLISSIPQCVSGFHFADSSADVFGLATRATSTCSDSSYTQCGDSNLPSNFCCGPKTSCIVLNNATSIMCCPEGSDCQSISPITCDISQQNATLHPTSSFLSTNLTATLESCGDACCPQGYTCQKGSNACLMDTESSPSSAGASTVSSTATASSTNAASSSTNTASPTSGAASTTSISRQSSTIAASSSSPTNTSSSSNNNTTVVPLKTQHCPALPGTAIVAGFFPGFIAGILLALLTPRCLGWCRRRRIEHENARDPDLTSMTTISGKVSNPIYQPQYGCRTDFLRQNSISRSAAVSNRVKSLFSRSPSTVTRGVYGRDRGLERGGDTPTTISTAASTCNSSTASLEPPAQSQMQHAQHPLTPTLPPNQYSKAGVVLTPARTTSTKSASKMTPTSIKQNKDRNTALTRSSSTESISVVFSPPRPLRPTPNRSDTSTPPSQPENPFLQPSAVIHSPPRPSKGPPRATNTPPPRTTATITRVPPPIPPPIPPRRLAVPVAVPTYQTLQQQHHSQHLQPQTYRESPTQQSQRDRDSHMTSGTTFTAMMQDAGLRGDDIFFTPSPPLPNSAVTAKGEGPRPLSLGAGYSNRAKIEGGGLRIKDV